MLRRSPDDGGLSYARYVQLARVSRRAAHESERREWERAAFVGWQVASAQGATQATWGAWRQQLKLDEPAVPAEPVDERTELERIRDMAHRTMLADEKRRPKA